MIVKERNITIKELTTKEELQAYFHLRYKEYVRAGFYIAENKDEFDVEKYDFYARFAGAFLSINGREYLVGGGRMVEKYKQGPMSSLVREICDSSSDLKHLKHLPCPVPFQLMESIDLKWLLFKYMVQNKCVVEFGRTVVAYKFCRDGVGGMIVNALHKLGSSVGADIGIGYCPAKLKPFYVLNDCRVLQEFDHPIHKWPALLVEVDLQNITSFIEEKVLIQS